MSFQSFSNEVLLQIIDHFDEGPPLERFGMQTDIKQISGSMAHYESRLKCLRAFMLSSKRLQALVEPYLYSRVVITKLAQLVSLERSISERTELASRVKHLYLKEDLLFATWEEESLPLQSEYAAQWDSVAETVLHKTKNLQSFSFERLSSTQGSELQDLLHRYLGSGSTEMMPTESEMRPDLSTATPEHLRHLTFSYKGHLYQSIDLSTILSFLKLQSATTLHLNRLRFHMLSPSRFASLSRDFISPLRELQLNSCDIRANILTSMIQFVPYLERFSYQVSAFERHRLQNVEELLAALSLVQDSLQELRITYEQDYQPYTLLPSQNTNLPALLANFSVLVSLGIDARALSWTSWAQLAQSPHYRFPIGSIQPSIKHLTIYHCDFETYTRITELAASKITQGLGLETITLSFHPDFPHWPSVIDPIHSLVAAEVREHLAAQTKVIEREYDELSSGQTFTSMPVSWSRPLPNPLIPRKEIIARETCKDNGISLHVLHKDPFQENKDLWNAGQRRR